MNCYVLRPFAPATACQITPNHQPVELLIYGYSLKHTMRETKGLGEDIHFRLGLFGDTTRKKHNTEGTRKFPSKQFRGPPLLACKLVFKMLVASRQRTEYLFPVLGYILDSFYLKVKVPAHGCRKTQRPFAFQMSASKRVHLPYLLSLI